MKEEKTRVFRSPSWEHVIYVTYCAGWMITNRVGEAITSVYIPNTNGMLHEDFVPANYTECKE